MTDPAIIKPGETLAGDVIVAAADGG